MDRDGVAGAMELLALEAERQGFEVKQAASSAWWFRKDNQSLFVRPHSAEEVLSTLAALERLGLVWRDWDNPRDDWHRD